MISFPRSRRDSKWPPNPQFILALSEPMLNQEGVDSPYQLLLITSDLLRDTVWSFTTLINILLESVLEQNLLLTFSILMATFYIYIFIYIMLPQILSRFFLSVKVPTSKLVSTTPKSILQIAVRNGNILLKSGKLRTSEKL